MENKQANISTYIGMGLIFILLYLWMRFSAPPPVDPKPAQGRKEQPTSAAAAPVVPPSATTAPVSNNAAATEKFGAFAPAAEGVEQVYYLKNNRLTVAFTNRGGRIDRVLLNDYFKINADTAGNDVKSALLLLEDRKNSFGYELKVPSANGGKIYTGDLYFTVTQTENSLTFRANTNSGGYLEQRYTLSPDSYHMDYRVEAKGLQTELGAPQAQMVIHNYLDKLEKNQAYERTMSTVYYKPSSSSSSYCDCKSDDIEQLGSKPLQWFSHSNQFFNTTFIARDFAFTEFVGETKVFTDAEPDLKLLKTSVGVSLDKPLHMSLYTGPNEFDRLRSFGVNLEDIIPFGASLFGSINRWVIQPIFDVLSNLVGLPGVVILLLTLLVKLLLFPLTYKMVYSQARMSALKPKIDELRKKLGDDQQALSVETMRLYSEFKVNPLGGCLPIFLQMPIWFALYRFFPAAIEFRQAGFLWASDLSSYDVAVHLPTMVPGFGNHISAFTLIWVVTTLWYTWYTMKQMDSSAMANPAMKYLQYFMPLIFMFFFNSFASGLTLYLCFSNLLNIGQTVVTKQFLIDHEKIKLELEANKNKPKKTTGFRARLEQAMKEAQKQQDERNKQQKKK
jgi:YidC/Oxa1 family membrane protein insertase